MTKTTVAENGFEGILFPVDKRKDKVVIVVSGSNGGMHMTRPVLNFIAKMGFLL